MFANQAQIQGVFANFLVPNNAPIVPQAMPWFAPPVPAQTTEPRPNTNYDDEIYLAAHTLNNLRRK